MHEEHPELLRDQYWEDVVPRDLPYTLAAEQYRKGEPPGSADHYKVPPSESVYANLPTSPRKSHTDDTYADYVSNFSMYLIYYKPQYIIIINLLEK